MFKGIVHEMAKLGLNVLKKSFWTFSSKIIYKIKKKTVIFGSWDPGLYFDLKYIGSKMRSIWSVSYVKAEFYIGLLYVTLCYGHHNIVPTPTQLSWAWLELGNRLSVTFWQYS